MFGDVIKQQDSNALSFEWLEVLYIYLLYMCNPWGKTPSSNLKYVSLEQYVKYGFFESLLFGERLWQLQFMETLCHFMINTLRMVLFLL
jgi:hypothetical protein